MTQQVDKYFGIHLSIDTEIDKNEYLDLKKKLSERLKDVNDVNPKNVEIYIHKLDIEIKSKHLGISSLEARLARLNVALKLNKKAKESGLIWFLNPELAPVKLDPEVIVKFRKYRLSYLLTGEYCSEHAGYSDFIATLVVEGCPSKHKVLTLIATASATDRLKQKISNFQGDITTKRQFPLSRDIQISLDL